MAASIPQHNGASKEGRKRDFLLRLLDVNFSAKYKRLERLEVKEFLSAIRHCMSKLNINKRNSRHCLRVFHLNSPEALFKVNSYKS